MSKKHVWPKQNTVSYGNNFEIEVLKLSCFPDLHSSIFFVYYVKNWTTNIFANLEDC